MSGPAVLLDSVILIDHFNGIDQATVFLGSVGREAYVSPITRAEVLTGFDAAERDLARALLDCFGARHRRRRRRPAAPRRMEAP